VPGAAKAGRGEQQPGRVVRVLPGELEESTEVLRRPRAHLLVLTTGRGGLWDLGPASRVGLEQVPAYGRLQALANDGGEVGNGTVR
jgi:hypothetical protein